jgi:hypothetical protein
MSSVVHKFYSGNFLLWCMMMALFSERNSPLFRNARRHFSKSSHEDNGRVENNFPTYI